MIERVFLQIAADDAEPACDHGRTCADIWLTGDIVEVDPLLPAVHNALGTQNLSVFARSERLERASQLLFCELLARLHAPAGEHFVGVVVMGMIMAAMPVLVVAMRVVKPVVLVVVPVMVLAMVVLVLVIAVMTAMAVLMIVILVFVIIVMVMIMVFMTMVAMFVLIVMSDLGSELFQFLFQRILLLHGGKDILTVDRVPVGRYNGDVGMLAQEFDRFLHLCFVRGMREHNAACVLDLIKEKFPEVFQIHLALLGIHHSAGGIALRALGVRLLNGADDVGELADARRLDDDAIGRILCRDLF